MDDNAYRELEAKHRELERQVQGEANEERRMLRSRVEKLELTYMCRSDLENSFKERDITDKELAKRLATIEVRLGTFVGVLFTLKVLAEHLFK